MKIILNIDSCIDCPHYRYIRCHGYDCMHPEAPEDEADRGNESRAESRKGDFPKWCPFKKAEGYTDEQNEII